LAKDDNEIAVLAQQQQHVVSNAIQQQQQQQNQANANFSVDFLRWMKQK
jgi:hypothetical protein